MGKRAPVLFIALSISLLIAANLFATPINFGCAAISNHRSASHPISVVTADIYVNRFKTTMRLKCFAEDLELLQGVEALETGFYDPEELVDATYDHSKYLLEKIELLNVDGEKMKGKIMEVLEFEIPEEGIRAGTLMEYQMEFTIEYAYEAAPEFITINQKMVAEGQLLPSELKILLKQAGSDTPYTKMLKPDAAETFRFDWDKPVLNDEASEKEWEEWFADQREKTLGITSYSSVYSFIYITRYEVRHEVLIPLANLATFIDIEREDPGFLTIEEQDAAQKKIEAFFAIGNPVEIDSVVVQPVFDRVDFYGLDLRDFAVQAERRRISMANGRIGVIMSHSTKGTPSNVKVTWDKFNTSIKTVDSFVFPMDGEIEKTEFTMFLKNNTFEWNAPESKPLPPIVGIDVKDQAAKMVTPKLNLPFVAIALFGIGFVTLLISLVVKSDAPKLVVAACLFAMTGMFTLPFFSMPIDDPFAAPVLELPEDDANLVFAQLHKNMFRAFDYHHESDIYDALAKSVDGDLLRELYLDINESLKIREQGGAVSKIEEVNLVETNKTSPVEQFSNEDPGFAVKSKWNLIGTVEHWGHIHQRTNQYDAVFNVQLKEDAWKITAMKVNDETQGPVKTSLSEF